MKPVLEALKWLFQNLYHVAEDAIAIAKKYSQMYLQALVRMLLTAVIVPVSLFLLGTVFDLRWVIALSGILGAIAMFGLLVLATPLGILIEIVLNGPSGSGLRYVKAASGILLFELCFSFFGSLLPIGQNLSTLPLLTVGALILSLLNTWLFRREIVGFIVGLIFLGVVLSFYFPLTFSDFGQKITDLDFYVGKPTLVKVSLQQIQQRSVEFFRPDGESRYWYYLNSNREVELYDHEGVHPIYRQKLKPITEEVVAYLERQLFVSDSLHKVAQAQAAEKQAIADRTRLAEAQRRETVRQSEKRAAEVSPRPPSIREEPTLSAGMRFAFKQKKIKGVLDFGGRGGGPHEVTLYSIEILEGMFVKATLSVENTSSFTYHFALVDPDAHTFIVDQTGARSQFLSSENFPRELPPGIPLRFAFVFGAIPNTTRTVFISFRLAPLPDPRYSKQRNLDEPNLRYAKDLVIRDITLR